MAYLYLICRKICRKNMNVFTMHDNEVHILQYEELLLFHLPQEQQNGKHEQNSGISQHPPYVRENL